ncbi:MAG: sugar transferase [Acidibacillus sp.]|nr:sugar transferase [Acidibacillus sp.]
MGERLRFIHTTQYILQVITLVFSFNIAYELFRLIEGRSPFHITSTISFITFASLLLVWGVVFSLSREAHADITRPFKVQAAQIIRLSILASLLYGAISYMFRFTMLSRLIAIAYSLTVTLALLLILVFMKIGFRMIRTHQTCVLVMQHEDELNIARIGTEVAAAGMQLTGVIGHESAHSIPYLGQLDDLPRLLETMAIDTVLMHPFLSSQEIERCLGECQLRGIPTELLIGHMALQAATREVIQTPYGTAIRLLPHRTTAISLFLKRLTDLIISAFALIILAIPFLILIAIIRLTSSGPAFFVQERSGLHGRTFPCLKFRTMVDNAEELKEQLLHLNEMSGPVFKIKADPRITPIGKFLRKTSLDELPQLINVLLGHMSLVGPRPPLPSEVAQYASWQRRRLSVRPGITCLWQIGGRNTIDFDEWMTLDLRYIDSWSYLYDWIILFKTIPAVLFRNGAS